MQDPCSQDGDPGWRREKDPGVKKEVPGGAGGGLPTQSLRTSQT